MTNVQKITVSLPADLDRVESGSVQFEYPSGRIDWTGLFLRGDDCCRVGLSLKQALDEAGQHISPMDLLVLKGHVADLLGTNEQRTE